MDKRYIFQYTTNNKRRKEKEIQSRTDMRGKEKKKEGKKRDLEPNHLTNGK